jgi:hypothetical protein
MDRTIILTRQDILHLDEIAILIFECEKNVDIDKIYQRLGNLIWDNVEKLNLDEDIMNISRFAVGLALELSEFLIKRERGSHWEWHPVEQKVNNQSRDNADVRSKEKQIAGMIDVLIFQLKNDELFRASVNVLKDYQDKHQLWTQDDEPMID